MIARLQMSDLHLGDPRSVLSNPVIAEKVVANLAELSGGHIGMLIIDGDGWEECVPGDINRQLSGIAVSVSRASSAFLGRLFAVVQVDSVVVVPGNHDLSTWHWYAMQQKISAVTPYEGVAVNPHDWPWRFLLPGCPDKLTFAYPLYWDKTVGDDYPMLVVTHGHLLDDLVLGEDTDATYASLQTLGCRRPLLPKECSVRKVAEATLDFCLALWKRYSERDYVFFNKIMRRLEHPQSCQLSPIFHTEGFYQLNNVMCQADESPTAQGHSANLPWLLDTIICDPYLPTPVGSLRQGAVGPAFTRPSCLTFGHDHLALRRELVACGVPWVAVDSGGWTCEYDGHVPHNHVLVWKEVTDIVPTTYVVKARTSDGSVL